MKTSDRHQDKQSQKKKGLSHNNKTKKAKKWDVSFCHKMFSYLYLFRMCVEKLKPRHYIAIYF